VRGSESGTKGKNDQSNNDQKYEGQSKSMDLKEIDKDYNVNN